MIATVEEPCADFKIQAIAKGKKIPKVLIIEAFSFMKFTIPASVITFVINYAAYFCEIFRGSILGIDKGQYEASKVLGLSYWQTMIRIIIPQSLITAIPPLSNEAIALVKDTSLVSVIGMAEILRNSKELVTRDFSILPFAICGVLYFLMSVVIIMLFKKLEQKVMI